MNIKQLTLAALAVTTGTALAAMPEVSNVTMTQAANRLVTITYQLTDAPAVVTLDIQTNANVSAAANDPGWTSIGGTAICNAQGDVWRKVGNDLVQGQTFSGTITWQPDQTWTGTDGNGFKIAANGARARVTAWPLDNTPDYMVVDISAGAQPNTQRYYPATDFIPGGLLGMDEYRTTMIVMRKIMAKDVVWTMGSTLQETQRKPQLCTDEDTHAVQLTNNYYIGVFEVTQTQWALIQTGRPTPAKHSVEGAMRPVEDVCYNEIRNAAADTTAATAAYNWPAAPNPASFLGLLRTKTGIDFDLPSEAQWEFACRAGHGDTKYGDGSTIMNALSEADANLDRLARYRMNSGMRGIAEPSDGGPTNCTAIVGSYEPNSWGLYDMLGNVWEQSLDWCESDITGFNGAVNIDPANSAKTLSGATGSNRTIRGGGWNHYGIPHCRPATRLAFSPTGRDKTIGFRVVCTAGLQ